MERRGSVVWQGLSDQQQITIIEYIPILLFSPEKKRVVMLKHEKEE